MLPAQLLARLLLREELPLALRFERLFELRDDRDGTLAPFSRASLRPIAIACLRLFTRPPEPLLSVPRLRRRIADSTFLLADLPYFAIDTSRRAQAIGVLNTTSHQWAASAAANRLWYRLGGGIAPPRRRMRGVFRKRGFRADEPLVTIATFETSFEASLARGALESIGIRAMVTTEATGLFSTHRPGLATSELQVFQSDGARASVELRRLTMRIVEPPEDEL